MGSTSIESMQYTSVHITNTPVYKIKCWCMKPIDAQIHTYNTIKTIPIKNPRQGPMV